MGTAGDQYTLTIGIFLLLFLIRQQQATATRGKRAAICFTACARLLIEYRGISPLSRREMESLLTRCRCKESLDAQSRHRRVRSINEDTTTPSDNTNDVPTIAESNRTTNRSTSPSNPVTLPGVVLPGGIRIVAEDTDLSKFSLSTPDPSKPPPTIPSHILKHLFPRIHNAQRACPYGTDNTYNGTYVDKDVNVTVGFLQSQTNDWYANVTWWPPEGEEDVVQEYLVMWNVEDDRDEEGLLRPRCKLLPKDRFSLTLNKSEGWTYPRYLYLKVMPLPRRSLNTEFDEYYPKSGELIPVPPPKKPKDAGKLTLTIALGLLSGAVLIVFVFVMIYKRRCRTRPGVDEIESLTNHDLDNNKINFKKSNKDLYFATYFQESEKHTEKVAIVVTMLRKDGYNVVIDQFENLEINDLGFWRWVDNHMNKAKKILVFCSPGYIKLWSALGNGETPKNPDDKDVLRVRYEINRIGNMYAEKLSTANLICINMDKKVKLGNDLPPWMKHNILLWPEQRDEIYRRMIDQRAMVPIV